MSPSPAGPITPAQYEHLFNGGSPPPAPFSGIVGRVLRVGSR
jgi:hypothetical protein